MSFRSVLAELGNPIIYRVPPWQFAALPGGWDIGSDAGGALVHGRRVIAPVITAHPGMRGAALDGTYLHECGHILYYYWPEWKIYLWAWIMNGRKGGNGGAACLGKHTADELPPRSRLQENVRRLVARRKGSVNQKSA